MIYEIFINDVQLDLDTEVIVALNYAVADFKEPEKKKRSFSKKTSLPGTRKNNSFFSSAADPHALDLNASGLTFNFDPTVRYPVRVTRNGKGIFTGTVNLNNVDKLNGVYRYNVTLYSDVANIIQGLGDIMISELGWSEYDHVLSVANIQASWSTPVGSGYLYPLIDYGFAVDPKFVKTNQLRAYVYGLEVFQKCLAHMGYTLNSSFLNTQLIKKMVIGQGGGYPLDLTAPEISQRQVNYQGDGSAAHLFPKSFLESGDSWFFFYSITIIPTTLSMVLLNDDLIQFDDEQIVIANGGYYNLNLVADLDLTYSMAVAGFEIKLETRLDIFKNGAIINTQIINTVSLIAGSSTLNFDLSQEFDLDSGDVITFRIKIGTHNTTSSIDDVLSLSWDLNNTLFMNLTAVNAELIDGDTVQISRYLPKLKAADFVKDWITMFNLYIDEPDDDNSLLVEDFEGFYFDTDDYDNWTDKEDQSKNIRIEPASTIKGKTYSFKFAQDRDYYKQRYFDQYGMDYGDFDYDVPSTFKKGEKLYQLKIAQSVPVQLAGSDIIIPRIIKFDESSGVTSPYKGKPRMFIYNGLISSDAWGLINSDTGIGTGFNEYPQVHHLDDLTTPTFDLNFGKPESVFYTATAYTTDNLFYAHHAAFIRELTGRDSKIKNAFYDLNESDLYHGFMRRVVNINGSIWRKNIIKDFRATSNETTKVELVRIREPKANKNFEVGNPQVIQLPISQLIPEDTPVTSDTTVDGYISYYPVDSSAGDVTMTLDSTALRVGYTVDIAKVTQGNKIIVNTIGQGVLIDGETEVWIANTNDSFTFQWDGDQFKII